jgi:hypothetical protein
MTVSRGGSCAKLCPYTWPLEGSLGPKNPPHPSHSGESFSKNCTWRSLWPSVDEQTAPLAFGDSSFEESTPRGDSGACARVLKKDLHCLHLEVFQTPAPATPSIPGNSSQLRSRTRSRRGSRRSVLARTMYRNLSNLPSLELSTHATGTLSMRLTSTVHNLKLCCLRVELIEVMS